MKIVVIQRLEPVLTEELELSDDGRDIDREWIGFALNQFDDQALEQAVLLKESSGATVTAIAIEDDGSDKMLKNALARGADAAFQIPLDADDVESRSSRALAPLYAAAIRTLAPDLVLVGILSNSDLYGELAPYLGAHTGWPQISAVTEVQLAAGKATVRQEYAGGRAARFDVDTPAIIGLQTAMQPPRYVAGSKLRDLLKVQIPVLELDGTPSGDLSHGTTLALPDQTRGAVMFDGDADDIAASIYSLLKEKGFVQ